MDSIERIKNAIKLKKVDKLPLDFEYLKETDIKNIFIRPPGDWKPKKYKPWYMDADVFREISEGDKGSKREDEWGTVWGFGDIVGLIGEAVEHPIKVMGSSLFEKLHFLFGFNETLLSIMTDPEEIGIFLDRLVDYNIKLIRKINSELNGKVHAIIGSDDWGTQKSTFIDPEIWRKMFKPRYKMISDEIHKNGFDFWFHSCGKIEEIIPDLIEIGVDVFQLLQPSSVFGIKEFGSRFAGKSCFGLYIDIQGTAVNGTEEEIIKEAEDLVDYWSNEYGSGIIAIDYQDPIAIGTNVKNSKIALKAFKNAFERKVRKYQT